LRKQQLIILLVVLLLESGSRRFSASAAIKGDAAIRFSMKSEDYEIAIYHRPRSEIREIPG
jgi:hypothetical protein